MAPTWHSKLPAWARNHAGLIVLYFLCFAITTIVLFPGLDDRDTYSMICYNQKGTYSNWQSIFTIFVLHEMNLLCPPLKDYNGLFLGTMVQYWFAQAIITAYATKRFFKQFFVTIIAAFFPPTWCLLIGMHKDTFMAVSCLLSCALMLIANSSRSKRTALVLCFFAFLSLFAALAERHNAIFGVFPLAVFLVSILLKQIPHQQFVRAHRGKVLALAMAVTTILLSLKWAFESTLLNFEAYPAQMVVTWDLVGISVRSKDLCLPNIYRDLKIPLSVDYLKKIYTEFDNSTLFWWKVDDETPLLYFIQNKKDYDQLVASWLSAIVKHPLAYLEHRSIAFLSVLGVLHYESAGNPYEFLRNPPTDKSLVPFETSPYWQYMRQYYKFPLHLDIPDWPMRAWPYLIFLSVVFVLCRLHIIRLKKGEYFLLLSAVCYTFGFFFADTSNNQRYMVYLICVAGIISAILAINARQRIRLPWLQKRAKQ